MKVNASCAPNKSFRVEEIPDKPGFALARFFENVVENEKKIDDKTSHVLANSYFFRLPKKKYITNTIGKYKKINS